MSIDAPARLLFSPVYEFTAPHMVSAVKFPSPLSTDGAKEVLFGSECGKGAEVLTGTDNVWRGEPLHGRKDQPVWDVYADGVDHLASAIYDLRLFQTAQYPSRKSGVDMGCAAKKTP